MKRRTLVVSAALLLSCCSGIPEIKLPRDPWPVHEDGRPYARCEGPEQACCATEAAPPGWEVRPCPTPEPTPEPTPDPTPTPEPDLSGCYLGPWVWHYRTCHGRALELGECVPAAPPADRLGVHVRDAARRALERAIAAGVASPEGLNPHTDEPRGTVAEADLARWAGLVAEELRGAGWCGHAGPPHAKEEVRLCASGEPVCEVHDVAIGGGPGGREWVGPSERHMPTIGYPKAGAPEPTATPDPGPALGALCPGTYPPCEPGDPGRCSKPWAEHLRDINAFNWSVPVVCATGRRHPDLQRWHCEDQANGAHRPRGGGALGCAPGDRIVADHPRAAAFAPKPDKCFGDSEQRPYPAPHSQTGELWHNGAPMGKREKDVLQREPDCLGVR